MEKTDIQRLRDLPIEEVAERLGIGVVRHKALCPFHDDHHESLSFDPRRNRCRCWACMDGGMDTIALVQRTMGTDFVGACRWLSDGDVGNLPHSRRIMRSGHAGSPAEPRPFDSARFARYFASPSLSRRARHFLYDERRLDPKVVAWARLASWTDRQGTEWLQIPYYDLRGNLVGLQNRNLMPGGSPRFRFPRGARCTIYNLQVMRLARKGEPVYITEGPSDCWAMLSSGRKAIAIPSATLLTDADRLILTDITSRLHTEWHMYPDSDVPGERLFLGLQKLLPSIVRHQLSPACKDYAQEYLKNCGIRNEELGMSSVELGIRNEELGMSSEE